MNPDDEPIDFDRRFAALPDPTPEMLESPVFEAIWQTIKSWDVNVPEAYVGYCGANGSHVRKILDAVQQFLAH